MRSWYMEQMLFTAVFNYSYVNPKINTEYHNTSPVQFITQTNKCTCALVGLDNKLYKMHGTYIKIHHSTILYLMYIVFQ
jgi:hypothetical protein